MIDGRDQNEVRTPPAQGACVTSCRLQLHLCTAHTSAHTRHYSNEKRLVCSIYIYTYILQTILFPFELILACASVCAVHRCNTGRRTDHTSPCAGGSAPLVYMIITTIMITTNTAVIFHETNAANITMIILITRFYNALRATVLR